MSSTSLHVIVGAGPVGSSIALRLAEAGHRVVVGTRSGSGPVHDLIERRKVDATDAKELQALARGAATIVNCANPPYTSWPKDWPPMAEAMLKAAKQTEAGLITMSNLYGYGPKHQLMRADTPLDATGPKGRVRADMWRNALAAHDAGAVRVAEVRASDFFGPGVVDANMGERVVPRVIRGKGVQLMGSADEPHSFSYMPDVAATLFAVATDETSWGRSWLVPSVNSTQRGMVTEFAKAAGVPAVKVSTVPNLVVSALGLVVPMMRALGEVRYQFASPFVADAGETTTRFGVAATDIGTACRETVAWWKARA